MSFQSRDSHLSPLCKSSHVLKFEDKIFIENMLLISMNKLLVAIKNLLPPIVNGWFTFCSDIHNYEITSSSTGKIFKA